jgi:hypothetical protein
MPERISGRLIPLGSDGFPHGYRALIGPLCPASSGVVGTGGDRDRHFCLELAAARFRSFVVHPWFSLTALERVNTTEGTLCPTVTAPIQVGKIAFEMFASKASRVTMTGIYSLAGQIPRSLLRSSNRSNLPAYLNASGLAPRIFTFTLDKYFSLNEGVRATNCANFQPN